MTDLVAKSPEPGWLLVYQNRDYSMIVDSSDQFNRDLEEAIGYPCQCSDIGIALPPGPGLWLWRGHMVTIYDGGDYDVDYRGKYQEPALFVYDHHHHPSPES